MTEAVDDERRSRYNSPLRARQAAATRQAVLEAASRLFVERGWTGATLAAVAREAGTAVETVYSGFGSKSGLLTSAIDVALVGDDEDQPLVDRPAFVALGQGDRGERFSAAASIIVTAHARSVPLLRALQEAAASDTAARARWEKYETDRRRVIATGLELALGRNPDDSEVDSIWALASPEVFSKLVYERHWSLDRYSQWLQTLALSLLGLPDVRDGD
jgi:AcrR family transcriptional regulator